MTYYLVKHRENFTYILAVLEMKHADRRIYGDDLPIMRSSRALRAKNAQIQTIY